MDFRQCADGLNDCSVWRFCDDMEMTRMPDGTTRVVNSLIWRPVKFGPATLADHNRFEMLMAKVEAARAKVRA